MAVKLRLQRHGAKKSPFYRIVAADSRAPRDGRFLEVVGTYDPTREPLELRLKNERVQHWLSVGALPTDTVASLLRRAKRNPEILEAKSATHTPKGTQAAKAAAAPAADEASA